MVKGLSRRVIVVDSPDPHIFEQAIFIVRNDAAVGSGGVTSQQVVDQAIRIAKDYARTHGAPPRRRLRMSPWLAALLGGAAIGAVIMSSISRLLVFIGLPSTYDNTITFNGDGFTVVEEEGKFEVVDGNKIKVNDNQDVKFKLNITSGYELVSVKLGDEVLTASNGVYTINNVTKNLTVTVTTKPVAQAKGTVGIVDENSDAQALGVAYQGDKPTLDEALAAVRKYITDKGFVIDDANSSVDAAGKYTFAVTKGGY